MRYSIYKYIVDESIHYKLFLEHPSKDKVLIYEFQTDDYFISNELGITRLFGKLKYCANPKYFLYPLIEKNIATGNCIIEESNPDYIKLNFGDKEENVSFQFYGIWLIRYLKNGQVLFWKPDSLIKNEYESIIKQNEDYTDVTKNVEQKLGLFVLENINKNKFEGILICEGIWTGMDRSTTYYTKSNIKQMYQDIIKNKEKLIIDYDHDEINAAQLDSCELREHRNLLYIYITGSSQKEIPPRSGISITLRSKIVWDKNLNVWIRQSGEVLGFSIMVENLPACEICMIR